MTEATVAQPAAAQHEPSAKLAAFSSYVKSKSDEREVSPAGIGTRLRIMQGVLASPELSQDARFAKYRQELGELLSKPVDFRAYQEFVGRLHSELEKIAPAQSFAANTPAVDPRLASLAGVIPYRDVGGGISHNPRFGAQADVSVSPYNASVSGIGGPKGKEGYGLGVSGTNASAMLFLRNRHIMPSASVNILGLNVGYDAGVSISAGPVSYMPGVGIGWSWLGLAFAAGQGMIGDTVGALSGAKTEWFSRPHKAMLNLIDSQFSFALYPFKKYFEARANRKREFSTDEVGKIEDALSGRTGERIWQAGERIKELKKANSELADISKDLRKAEKKLKKAQGEEKQKLEDDKKSLEGRRDAILAAHGDRDAIKVKMKEAKKEREMLISDMREYGNFGRLANYRNLSPELRGRLSAASEDMALRVSEEAAYAYQFGFRGVIPRFARKREFVKRGIEVNTEKKLRENGEMLSGKRKFDENRFEMNLSYLQARLGYYSQTKQLNGMLPGEKERRKEENRQMDRGKVAFDESRYSDNKNYISNARPAESGMPDALAARVDAHLQTALNSQQHRQYAAKNTNAGEQNQ
jgi:hypothetical protein